MLVLDLCCLFFFQKKADNVMEWYAIQLLSPTGRILAMVGFVALYVILCYGTSRMTQKFHLAEVLPRDSYVSDYLYAASHYRNANLKTIQVVFRNVDQSNPLVRHAMVEYTKELGERLDRFVLEPDLESFWMTQFELFLQENNNNNEPSNNNNNNTAAPTTPLPFVQALDLFLANPLHRATFGDHIVRDATNGEIIASRVHMKIIVSETNVPEQIQYRNTERLVTLRQSVNQDPQQRGDDNHHPYLSFFTFAKAYTAYENYSRGIHDLVDTAVTGVVAVTFVALLLIPHWSAALVVGPLIIVLFIELLGFLHWGGLFLNSMTSLSVRCWNPLSHSCMFVVVVVGMLEC
jgi:Patched family